MRPKLSFRCDAVTWESHVRPAVVAQVEDWLLGHPSRVRLDETAARSEDAQLARLEMEQGPLSPWIADNTVVEAPYDHRLQDLGSRAASNLRADLLADTTEPAFQMYDALRTGTPLPELMLDLLWTTQAAAAMPLRLSLRSHADAFLSQTGNPDAYRAAFDDKFELQRDMLADRLREVAATLSGTGHVPFVTEWAELIRRHQRAAIISSSDWFASFRLVVSYLYFHCNRLGLKPLDRAVLCHLAASAVEMHVSKRGNWG